MGHVVSSYHNDIVMLEREKKSVNVA